MIRVWIELREACVSEMICVVLCPEVFEISKDDGKAVIKLQWRSSKVNEGYVPGDFEDCVVAAYENCPVEIVK
ncbi:MAG: ferredoxin [Candidatus Bathyarchaeia archaeon]